MRIAYVSHGRFPTEKAHGSQIAHVCAALTRLGHEVTLVVPTVRNAVTEDPFAYYGLRDRFTVERLVHYDAQALDILPATVRFGAGMFLYRRALRRWLKTQHNDVLYTRSPLLLGPLLSTELPVILELHTLPARFRGAFVTLCKRCVLVVCLTSQMQRELASWGVPSQRLLTEGDAVDPLRFAAMPEKAEARGGLGLGNGPVVGYVGRLATLGMTKGVDVLVEALALLRGRGRDVTGLIAGGPSEEVEKLRVLCRARGLPDDSVRLLGDVPAGHVATCLAAADVLVYPAPKSNHPYFVRDTSPLKLFEYMAAGRPIVAADLPPLHDVLDSSVARFVTAGDASALAEGIIDLLDHPGQAQTQALAASRLVKRHTWDERMARIIRCFSTLNALPRPH